MKQVLYIDAERTGYSIDQIHSTMTAGELISYLEQFDEDTPVCSRARDIAARAADVTFDYLDAPIKTVTAPDTPVPFSAVLEAIYSPQAEDIVHAAVSQVR